MIPWSTSLWSTKNMNIWCEKESFLIKSQNWNSSVKILKSNLSDNRIESYLRCEQDAPVPWWTAPSLLRKLLLVITGSKLANDGGWIGAFHPVNVFLSYLLRQEQTRTGPEIPIFKMLWAKLAKNTQCLKYDIRNKQTGFTITILIKHVKGRRIWSQNFIDINIQIQKYVEQ